LGTALPAQAQGQTQSPIQKSFEQARGVLDTALKAAGGADALRAVKDVTRVGKGTAFNQGQSLKPDDPLTSRTVEVRQASDFAGGRLANEFATTPAGGNLTRTRSVVTADAGFNFNRLTGVVSTLTPMAVTNARSVLRRDPAALLLTAEARSETLRALGEVNIDGTPQRVISFADSDGTVLTLYIDSKTGLVSKYETFGDNAVLGDTLNEVVFSDYRVVNGVQLPFRVVNRTGGVVTQDIVYSDIKVNAGAPADLFADAPASAARVQPGTPPTNVTLSKIGDNAYFVSGSSHNSLAVAFADHVLLVEAPQSPERATLVMAKVKEAFPGKPIRFVVPTHYHFDHSGGLRAAIAEGATIVTTPGNKAFVERMATAPHTVKPDALQRTPRKPTVETFTGKRVFSDATNTLELYDVGPSPHVAEILVAYLPKEKVLFVADIFGIPQEGPLPPGSATNKAFADKIKELKLDVAQFAPGHGKLGTPADLAAVLAKNPPSDVAAQ
jgi:glyoxylase-like metal-dependent hydrolase (beta-lactamase superfamily II)